MLPLWLVGQPPLVKRLHQQQHDALRTRIAVEMRLEALDRQTFGAAVEHAFKAADATQSVLSDPAVELLFRASRGVLRVAAKILRVASNCPLGRPCEHTVSFRAPSDAYQIAIFVGIQRGDERMPITEGPMESDRRAWLDTLPVAYK